MSRANWVIFEDGVSDVKSVSLNISDVLEAKWGDDYEVTLMKNDLPITLDLRDLCVPLGRAWRVFYREKDYNTIKDTLSKFWAYTKKPIIISDVVKGKIDGEEKSVQIRTKITNVEDTVPLQNIFEDMKKGMLEYDKVVVGTNGRNVELQFLQKSRRTEIREGDFVDVGMFVAVNGGVSVSAGLNRLVCTNGLVERMYLWQGKDYRFSREFFDRAGELVKWFAKMAEKKVSSVRHLSIVFDKFPKFIVRNHWKKWTEKIELGELYWYDVIGDITQDANKIINPQRYKVLSIRDRIISSETECRCPTCSAAIKNV